MNDFWGTVPVATRSNSDTPQIYKIIFMAAAYESVLFI